MTRHLASPIYGRLRQEFLTGKTEKKSSPQNVEEHRTQYSTANVASVRAHGAAEAGKEQAHSVCLLLSPRAGSGIPFAIHSSQDTFRGSRLRAKMNLLRGRNPCPRRAVVRIVYITSRSLSQKSRGR